MSDSSKGASDILIEHWNKGTTLKHLPEDVRPANSAAGYDIQKHVERITDKPLWGWKIAATSLAGQKHINVDRPLAGRVLEERVARPTSDEPIPTVPLGPNRMLVAELEFVFLMGRALSPQKDAKVYSMEEVMEAVEDLYLGSEIPDSRYEDFTAAGAAQLIADCACADRYVMGPKVEKDWRSQNLASHVVRGWATDSSGEQREAHHGSGAAVLGDPRIALTWLVNELNEHGMTLEKGQFVTTGTCIIPIPVQPGDTVVGDYGDFGTLKLKFVQ